MSYEIIDRPGLGRKDDGLTEALSGTSESGKAISVHLNGVKATTYLNRFCQYFGPRGFRVRMRTLDAEHCAFWLEKKA